MGGSTKQNAKFKIGKFGTGLKYTLAYLYRNNIDFHCFSGSQEIKIHLEKELIGETEFEIICINMNRTSITTQMGYGWSAWMIIREIWCNALDEGDSLKQIVSDEEIKGDDGKTSFYIQLTPEINEVVNNWNTYFIQSKTPLWENENYAIYPSHGEPLKLYKNGVLILQEPNSKSLFNYDIKGADINELREFKGIVSLEIMNALRSPNKEVINYFFENIKEDMYEGADMDYEWFSSFGEVWKSVLDNMKIVSYDTVRHVEQNGIDVAQIEKAIKLPKRIYTALTKTFNGVGVLRQVDDKSEFYDVPNIELEQYTKKVLRLLSDKGYFINPDLKIIYGIFEAKTRMVAVKFNAKELLISKLCLMLSEERFAAEIIGVNEKFTKNFADCSRDFQDHLTNLFAKSILQFQEAALPQTTRETVEKSNQ